MQISVGSVFQAKEEASVKPEPFGSLTCTRTNRESDVAGAERETTK